jgi:NhaP-type Na+/H+ or K+/H+ antiporter
MKNAIFLTPSFVFIIYGFTELLGYSGPVAALIFGITIGNADHLPIKSITERIKLSPISHNEMEKLFFSEIVFLLKTFFFVYLGISIVFTDLWTLYFGLVLTLVIFAGRFIASRISSEKNTPYLDTEFTYSMFAKGLATTVLASLPFQYGIPGGETLQNLVYVVIFISIILAGLTIFMVGKGYLRFLTKIFYKEPVENKL